MQMTTNNDRRRQPVFTEGTVRTTQTVYDDASRQITVKSDRDSNGDGLLVEKTWLDQLGRVRFSQDWAGNYVQRRIHRAPSDHFQLRTRLQSVRRLRRAYDGLEGAPSVTSRDAWWKSNISRAARCPHHGRVPTLPAPQRYPTAPTAQPRPMKRKCREPIAWMAWEDSIR
jgi:hypothetical protein